jgi:beta-N-acetylhexosaminidase
MFRDAITLLRNNRNALPLKKNSKVHIISVTEDSDLYAGEALGEVLRGNVHSVVVSRLWNGSSKEMVSGVAAETQKADAAILGVYLSIGAWKGENKVSPTLQELLKKIGRLNTLIVTVAFGDPYVLGKLSGADAMIAAYTGVRKAEEAVGRALLGLSPVQGKLPVTIPGSFRLGEGIMLAPVRDSGAK